MTWKVHVYNIMYLRQCIVETKSELEILETRSWSWTPWCFNNGAHLIAERGSGEPLPRILSNETNKEKIWYDSARKLKTNTKQNKKRSWAKSIVLLWMESFLFWLYTATILETKLSSSKSNPKKKKERSICHNHNATDKNHFSIEKAASKSVQQIIPNHSTRSNFDQYEYTLQWFKSTLNWVSEIQCQSKKKALVNHVVTVWW